MPQYSYSALNLFDQCPQKYKFKYIDRIEVPVRISADLYLGDAVHRSLKDLYKHVSDSIEYPLEKVLETYHAHWEKPKRTNIVPASEMYTIDDYVRIGREMLEKYYKKYQPFNEGVLLGSEMRLRFELPGTSFKFTAIIDLLLKREDGTIEIRDFKTGNKMFSHKEKGFYYQMGLYRLALQVSHPQYKDVELTHFYLRKDEIVRYKMSADELDLVANEYRNAVLEVQDAGRLGNFNPKEGSHCSYCEYFQHCPAKIHQRLMSDDGSEFEDLDEIERAKKGKEIADRLVELHTKKNEVTSEFETLKKEITEMSRLTGFSSFEAEGADVKVIIKQQEKFVTKTESAEAFAELVSKVRQLGHDEYMTVDTTALLKEAYLKKRLPENELEILKEFIRQKESATVRVNYKKPGEGE